MPLIFPYHFMATQFVVYEYRKMKKEDKLKDVLKTFELKESDENRKENMNCFLKLQGELESILSLKAELKRIIVGSFSPKMSKIPMGEGAHINSAKKTRFLLVALWVLTKMISLLTKIDSLLYPQQDILRIFRENLVT